MSGHKYSNRPAEYFGCRLISNVYCPAFVNTHKQVKQDTLLASFTFVLLSTPSSLAVTALQISNHFGAETSNGISRVKFSSRRSLQNKERFV